MSDEQVVVGDTIWFFVELLRQIADEPNPVLVRVKEIRTEADGSKMLVLEKRAAVSSDDGQTGLSEV